MNSLLPRQNSDGISLTINEQLMFRTLMLSLLVFLPAACGEAPDGERKAAVGNIARTLQNEVSNQVEIPENVERNVDSEAGSAGE